MNKRHLTKTVFARMSEQDIALIKMICTSRREDLSNFVRRAIYKELARMSYLSKAEKKALEISENKDQKNGVR